MRLQDPETLLAVSLDYDEDGFPIVLIDTLSSGSYYDADGRPTIEVLLDSVLLHSMFADGIPASVSLQALRERLNQFEGNPSVVLQPSASDPDAVVLSHLFAELA